MIINFLTVTNNSSIEETLWLVSIGIIILLTFVHSYSNVVYGKNIKGIGKMFTASFIFFLISTVLVAIKPLENSELTGLFASAIIFFFCEWVWEYFYFSKFWSGKRTKKMMVYRNLFAIAGIILIASHTCIFVKSFSTENFAYIIFILVYSVINLGIFATKRGCEEHRYY